MQLTNIMSRTTIGPSDGSTGWASYMVVERGSNSTMGEGHVLRSMPTFHSIPSTDKNAFRPVASGLCKK